MKKKLVAFLTIACLCFILAGCSAEKHSAAEQTKTTIKQSKNTEASTKAKAVTEKPVSQPVPAPKPTSQPKPKFVIANNDLSNLQLDDPSIPVYDLLSVQERRTKGLPTRLPKLQPYTKGKVAYLTFDDGPDEKNTIGVLDVLKHENVKATFYVLGSYCYHYPQTLLRMFVEGHAIGNHTFSHNYDRLYSSVDGFMQDIYATERVEREILGYRSLIVRAPGGKYGSFNSSYDAALVDAGLVAHDWNVCIDDAVGGNPTAADFVNKVATQTAQGRNPAIVLLHCSYGKGETVKALPQIIQLLRERGYSFGVITPMTPQPW